MLSGQVPTEPPRLGIGPHVGSAGQHQRLPPAAAEVRGPPYVGIDVVARLVVHDGHEPVLAPAITDHRAGIAAEPVLAAIDRRPVERVLHVPAHEERAPAEPVVGGDARARIDLARDGADPLVNGFGAARVLPVVGVDQTDLLGQLAVASREAGRLGQEPPGRGVVVLDHQQGEPGLDGQRGDARLPLEVERLELEVLRVRRDQPDQPAPDLVLLARGGETHHVVVEGALKRLHAAFGRGTRRICQIRPQVLRMCREDRTNLIQIAPGALAIGDSDGAANLSAHDQIERAVAVEIGEVDDRAVAQPVQIDRSGLRPGNAERAAFRQAWPGGAARVDPEVDVAPVVRDDEVRHSVLIDVRQPDVQVIRAPYGPALPVENRRRDVKRRRGCRAEVVGDLYVARPGPGNDVGEPVAVPVGHVGADVLGDEVVAGLALENRGRGQRRRTGRSRYVSVETNLAVGIRDDDEVLLSVPVQVNQGNRHAATAELNLAFGCSHLDARGETGRGCRPDVSI